MLVSYSFNCSIYKPGLGNNALPLIQGCCEGSEKLFQKDIAMAIFKTRLQGAQMFAEHRLWGSAFGPDLARWELLLWFSDL